MPSREHSKTLRHSPGLIKQRTIYVYIVYCWPMWLPGSWYKKLLLHIWLSCSIFAYYSIFFFPTAHQFPHSTPDVPAPSCLWVSLPFVGLRFVGLLKLMQVEVLQSKSLALVSGSWGQKGNDNVKAKEKKNASAPSSVSALMQALPPLLTPSPKFAFLWSVLQLMECCSGCCSSSLYLLLSAFPYPHAACGIQHSRHFQALPGRVNVCTCPVV